MKNSNSTADKLELYSGEEFSSHKFSMGADEDGWLLMRAFLSIRNQATRSVILDMVSALPSFHSSRSTGAGARTPKRCQLHSRKSVKTLNLAADVKSERKLLAKKIIAIAQGGERRSQTSRRFSARPPGCRDN
jgi:hypothetical protein